MATGCMLFEKKASPEFLMNAKADIAAIYEVNTSLDALMQYGQSAAGTDGAYGSADIEVIMRLTGPLLTPEIAFDIRSKEQGTLPACK